jgi:diguanylate cyclase (GGDEF)-like protein
MKAQKLPPISHQNALVLEDAVELRALRREGIVGRIAPFIIPALFGFIPSSVPLESPAQFNLSLIFLAAALSLVTLLSLFLVPWQRLPRQWEVLPPLSYLLIIFLVREGSTTASFVFAPLLLLPLFWLALYGTRQELLAGFLLMAAVNVGILWHSGGNKTGVQFQVVAIIVSPVICLTTQSLVQRIRQQAAQLSALALTDGLTGASNRRAWDEELPRAMSRARRYQQPLCIAICDLDNFKRWNDTNGHQAGDQLLRDLARNWQVHMRDSDFLSRFGGEEFAIMFQNCNSEGTDAVLQRLRAAVPSSQTCSIGVACWDGHETVASLIERADAAMYLAKEKGRDCIQLAAPAVDSIDRSHITAQDFNVDFPLIPAKV